MPVDGERVINPAMHLINIKTTKLQEMIDWYGLVLGARSIFKTLSWRSFQMIALTTASHFWPFLGSTTTRKNSFTLAFIIPLSIRFFCRSHVDLCAAEEGGHRTSVQY